MKRNDYQHKVVLDDEQMSTLKDALVIANEQMRASASVARSLNDHYTADLCAIKAAKFQEMLTASPEVVRVAVTLEYPAFDLYAVDSL